MTKAHRFTDGKIFYLLVFVSISLFVIGLDTYFSYRNFQNFTLAEEQEMQQNFDAQEYTLKKISDLIFATQINTDEVISLYKQLPNADEKQKALIREKLFKLLEKPYQIFKNFQIQQLHFQLPDNESFLRFHKPQMFGDSLVGVRPTIEYVNRTHKPINGFEEGRIFNGFRHVYPLFDDENNYLGSVEVSSSALSYKKVFEVSEKKEMDIVLREDVVKTKLFSSEQGNYVPYSMNPSFLIERAMVEDDLKNRIDRDHTKGLEKLSRRTDIREKMASMERFTIFDYHNGQFDLISFLPLTNTVSKAKVGYAIVFRESSYIQKALHEYLFEVSRALVESLFLTIVLYFIRSRAKVLKEREHTLKKAEDVNRAKDSFLANMSHELRTPLNAIIGFSQILMAKKDTPQNVKDIVEKIQLSGKNLLSLVNTILDFSKIEAGEMELHPSDFSLYELGKELGVLVEPMLYKKELSLILEINEEMSITADRQLLKQVLLNLLSNAIKFSSHKESITLSCTLESDKYLMSCCDRGHGIAEDKIATLFDPFTQIREHQKEAIKGTGLGLAIVKRIVELHDGKVWVESEVEKGSCFYITLPR